MGDREPAMHRVDSRAASQVSHEGSLPIRANSNFYTDTTESNGAWMSWGVTEPSTGNALVPAGRASRQIGLQRMPEAINNFTFIVNINSSNPEQALGNVQELIHSTSAGLAGTGVPSNILPRSATASSKRASTSVARDRTYSFTPEPGRRQKRKKPYDSPGLYPDDKRQRAQVIEIIDDAEQPENATGGSSTPGVQKEEETEQPHVESMIPLSADDWRSVTVKRSESEVARRQEEELEYVDRHAHSRDTIRTEPNSYLPPTMSAVPHAQVPNPAMYPTNHAPSPATQSHPMHQDHTIAHAPPHQPRQPSRVASRTPRIRHKRAAAHGAHLSPSTGTDNMSLASAPGSLPGQGQFPVKLQPTLPPLVSGSTPLSSPGTRQGQQPPPPPKKADHRRPLHGRIFCKYCYPDSQGVSFTPQGALLHLRNACPKFKASVDYQEAANAAGPGGDAARKVLMEKSAAIVEVFCPNDREFVSRAAALGRTPQQAMEWVRKATQGAVLCKNVRCACAQCKDLVFLPEYLASLERAATEQSASQRESCALRPVHGWHPQAFVP